MRHVTRQIRWTDRDGTEWTLLTMPPIRDLPQRVGFRSRGYAFVVILAGAGEDTELADEDLQACVDRALGRSDEGWRTARLWIDPRSRTEWEITADDGHVLFRRGTAVLRAPAAATDGHDGHPRDLSGEELQEALDAARARGT